jgi:hypothetical protein
MANTQYSPLASLDTSNEETPAAGGFTAEMGKPKAGTLGVAGKINLGPDQTSEILRNMQAELDKRTGPMNTFLGGLQRASAWGSGGANGPAAALTAMDREQLLRDQDTRAIQERMASIKGAEATRQAKIQSYGGMPGQFAQAGGQGAAPQTQGMTPIQQMISSLPLAQQPIAMNAWRSGDTDTIESLVVANEKNRTTEAKNLDLIERLPPGPKRDMLINQAFDKATANRTIITPEGEIPYTPGYAPKPPGMGGAAPTSTSGVNLRQVAIDAGIPASAIISDYRDPTKQLSLIDREDPNKPGSYLTKEGKPVALPGKSAHQIPGAALDLKPSFPITPVQKQALLQAGAVEVPGDPGHYQLPISKMNAALAVNATAPTESVGQFSSQSKEGKELITKGITGDNESIIKEIQNPMLAKVTAEKDLPPQITRTLDILDKTKTGPGASTAMLVTELKGFFKELKPDELQQLINQKTINQTQATLIASGIKAAFGAQLSDKEGDRFAKTLFTIDDPKQFIRASLELKRAAVYSNKDFANYLLGKPDKAKAIREYEELSDQRNNEILKKHAPTVYAQMQKAKETPTPAAAPAPAISNSSAETWLKANPNHPDAPAVRKKLGL